MFSALLALLILPIVDLSYLKGYQFRPISKFFFWTFVVTFIILFWIGSQHPVEPFVIVGQVATTFYFAYFIFFVPLIGIIENSLFDVALNRK